MPLMTPATSQLIRTLEITNLPSLPHILLRVLDMCNRDDASLKAIAEIIDKDAALSAKVIGASNTAQFSKQSKFNSLEQNLTLLGLDMVKTIAISSSFYQVFNNLSLTPGFDLRVFWGRSLTTAFLAKLIAKEIAYPHVEEAYFTGLLLDIGQLVMWSNFPKPYATLLAEKLDGIQLLSRESEKMGINHCEVGAWLVNNWNLNSFMADAVLYHHMPPDKVSDAHQLIQIAHVANSLAMNDENTTYQFAASEKTLGITAESFQRIIDNSRELVSKVAQSLGIEIDTTTTKSSTQAEQSERDSMRQQKSQLAMELRDIVLIGRNPLGAGTSVSLDETLASIQRSVQILFGFHNVVFFLPDQHGRTLEGKCLSAKSMLINEMTIPLNKANSIITNAFLNRTPSTSFTQTNEHIPSIMDEQITRLLGTEGFYCQPMFTQHTVAGVMIFGITEAQLAHIKKQQKLVSMFAQQSAQAINVLNTLDKQEARIKSEVSAAAITQARQIAHEANNPLGIIKNYMQLLSVKLSKEDRAQEDLKIIQEEIDRVSRIFHNMTVTTNPEASPQMDVNANDVIQNLYKISFESLFTQHQISVHTQFDPALPSIMTNRDKLIQIMINLMKNAATAMPKGGKLFIATRVNNMRNGHEYIEIAIKDDGPGIPADIMENLFQPVISRKGSHHGGLGLSIVKNLVDELDGKIFCQSNETSGTVFQILLPRHNGATA